MCGEKPDSRNTLQLSPGSPPRMRGKDSAPQVYHRQGGITPAYAGKRGKGNEQSNGNGDHPRVCGEKRRAACFAISAAGSPPRMRGKGCLSGRPLLTAGITPAYAGKSGATTSAQTTPPDHPRVCGEKAAWFLPCRIDQGSPPRMRGKVGRLLLRKEQSRITPAYAGKSGVEC